jgi:hypothetical protein
MPNELYWQLIWVVLGVVIFVAALFAGRSRSAMLVGRVALGTLFIAGGALFNALNLATGGNYKDFADSSYIPFVHHTWRSLVAPHQYIFIPLLVAFEATVGLLVLSGGRRTQLGLVGAIGFHIALLSFGWAFYPWSLAMFIAVGLLLWAERKHAAAPAAVEARAEQHLAA